MATKLILKKSSTAGAVPLTTDLEIGEVALNLADRKLYTKNNSNAVVAIGAAYVGTTAPTSPAEGDLWYNSTTDLLNSFNGTAWSPIYTHPTQTAISVDATNNGINVIDSVTVNTLGHVTAVTTRDLSAATTSAAGVMSAADKTKLDGIASGAEVNQNAFSSIIVSGQTTVEADSKTDALTLAVGTGISIATNATTDTITITNTAPDQTVSIASGSGITVSGTYPSFTVDHTDTSSQASVDNSGATVIQDVTLDSFGHITGLASVAITPTLIGAAATSHTHAIGDITSIVIDGTPADNEVLAYDTTTSKWINQTAAEAGLAVAAHNHTLDSLSNVTITSNANGEILRWNGTAWINNTLAEAGIQPAGSYLTAESDTLATVTGRGATTATAVSLTNATASTGTTSGALVVTGGVGVGGNLNVGGNTIITGNLTVNGTTTSVNSNTVNIGDNIIVLNADETGAASQNAGFEVERGTDTNVQFIWNETNDAWDMGDYTLQNVRLDGGSY